MSIYSELLISAIILLLWYVLKDGVYLGLERKGVIKDKQIQYVREMCKIWGMVPYSIRIWSDSQGVRRESGGNQILLRTNPRGHDCWIWCSGKETVYAYDIPFLETCYRYTISARRHYLFKEEEEMILKYMDDPSKLPSKRGKRLDFNEIDEIREKFNDEYLIKLNERKFFDAKLHWYANHPWHYGDTEKDKYAPTFDEVKEWYEERVKRLKQSCSKHCDIYNDKFITPTFCVRDKNLSIIDYKEELFKHALFKGDE